MFGQCGTCFAYTFHHSTSLRTVPILNLSHHLPTTTTFIPPTITILTTFPPLPPSSLLLPPHSPPPQYYHPHAHTTSTMHLHHLPPLPLSSICTTTTLTTSPLLPPSQTLPHYLVRYSSEWMSVGTRRTKNWIGLNQEVQPARGLNSQLARRKKMIFLNLKHKLHQPDHIKHLFYILH